MRNATSFWLFGASSLVLTLVGACGGGDGGSRDDAATGAKTNGAGMTSTSAGTGSSAGGNSTSGGSTGTGGAPTCSPTPGSKKGDGTDLVIDDIDDTNTLFAPAGVGSGSWDFSKDASIGTITPAGTMALAPVAGGHEGTALNVQGAGLTGWGASLAAFLNGTTGAFDASDYGGVAFWIKGTTTVQEGTSKVMIQARMPDVLPGPGSCCSDAVVGSECYSGHRVVIGIAADWQEVRIPWSEFKGPAWGLGSTMAFNPNRIRDINFSFNHDPNLKTDTGSSFNVWVDGMRFMSKTEMGNVTGGGSGGSGGTGSGGSGGGGAGGGSAVGGSAAGGTAAGSGGSGGSGGSH
jgi:hypothetical protein